MAHGQGKEASDKQDQARLAGRLVIVLACLALLLVSLLYSPTVVKADDGGSRALVLETAEVEETPEITENSYGRSNARSSNSDQVNSDSHGESDGN